MHLREPSSVATPPRSSPRSSGVARPSARVGIYRNHALATLGDNLTRHLPGRLPSGRQRFFADQRKNNLREHPQKKVKK